MHRKIVGAFILLTSIIGFNISYGINIQGEQSIEGDKVKQQLQGNYNTTQGEIDKMIKNQVKIGGDEANNIKCDSIMLVLKDTIKYESTKKGTFLAGVNSCKELDLNGDGIKETILSLKYVSYFRYRGNYRNISKLYVYNNKLKRVDSYTINGDYRILNFDDKKYIYGIERILNHYGDPTSFFKITDIYNLDDDYNFKPIYKTNGYYITNGGNISVKGQEQGILYFDIFADVNVDKNGDDSWKNYDIGMFLLDKNKYVKLGEHRESFNDYALRYDYYKTINVINISDYLGLTDKLAFLSLKTYDKAQLVLIDKDGNVRYINFKDVIHPHNGVVNLNNHIVLSRYNAKRRYRIVEPLYPGYILALNKEKLKNIINSNTREISDYIYKTNNYIILDGDSYTYNGFKTVKELDNNIIIVFLGAVGYLFDDTRGKLYDLGGIPVGEWSFYGDSYLYDFKLKLYSDIIMFNLYFIQRRRRYVDEARNVAFVYNKNNGKIIRKDREFHYGNSGPYGYYTSYMQPAQIYNGQIVMHINPAAQPYYSKYYARMWIVGADGSVRDFNAIGYRKTNLYKFLTTIEYNNPIYTNTLAGYLEDNEIKESLNRLGKGQYVLGHKGDSIVAYNLSNGKINYELSQMVSKGDYKLYYSLTLHKGELYYKGEKVEDITITQQPSLYTYGNILLVVAGNSYLYKNGERIPYNYEPLYKTIYDDGKYIIKVFKYPETGFERTLIYYKNGDTQKLIKEIENVNVDETYIKNVGNDLEIEGDKLKNTDTQSNFKKQYLKITYQTGYSYQIILGKLLKQKYIIWGNVNDYIDNIVIELKYFNTQYASWMNPRTVYYNFKIFYKDGTTKTVAFTSVLDFETIKSNIVKINNNIFMIFNKVIIDRKNIVYINWKMLNLKPINNKTLIIYQIDNRVYSSFTDRPLYKLNLYSIPSLYHLSSSKIKIMKANEYYKNCNVGDNIYVMDATFYIYWGWYRWSVSPVKVVKNIDINTENFVNVNCQR